MNLKTFWNPILITGKEQDVEYNCKVAMRSSAVQYIRTYFMLVFLYFEVILIFHYLI